MTRGDWTANGHQRRVAVARIRRSVAAGEPCALCRKPIDLDLKWPHLQSFTVDHRTARSQGGAMYDPANLQPAHLACNRAKGDGTSVRSPRQKPMRSTPTRSSRAW